LLLGTIEDFDTVPSNRTNFANLLSIFDFAAENAKITDWLAERDEFELAGDLVNGQ
jgi:hypothetical protein